MLRVIDFFLLVNNKMHGKIILEIEANGWHLRVIAQFSHRGLQGP